MSGLAGVGEIVSSRCELNARGDSPQKANYISITVTTDVKEIDFKLFLASGILSLILHLNPTCFSRQEVFTVICQGQ